MSTTSPEQPLLTIHCFGPFDVRLGGESLPGSLPKKGLWLLALLTLSHGRNLEREGLIGKLWPDSDVAQAQYNLRSTLSQLRTVLGTQATPTIPFQAIPHSRSYGAQVDLLAFDEAIACGDPLSLKNAVTLYRGDLLEGCPEEWAFKEREARETPVLQPFILLQSIIRSLDGTSLLYATVDALIIADRPEGICDVLERYPGDVRHNPGLESGVARVM